MCLHKKNLFISKYPLILSTYLYQIIFNFNSLYLYKLGIAPQIQDLYGVAKFTGKHTIITNYSLIIIDLVFQFYLNITDEEITAMAKELQKYGLQLPAFSKIGGILANEMPFDEAALHAAILAINDSIEKQNVSHTLASLKLIDARLINVIDDNSNYYQDCLYEAKKNKSNIAKTKVCLYLLLFGLIDFFD